jgi:cytoskeletal protein CcmA (bactofilin family)
LGNFRVGNEFFVNQESGETSLVLTEAQIDSLGGLNITTNGSTTEITGERVETGNLRFRDNNIISTFGTIEIDSASSDINLQSNTNILQNLTATGNLTLDGTLITLGNEESDTVNFLTQFSQDIVPDISGLYNLGSTTKIWQTAFLSETNISDINIKDNFITSSISNSNLELRANATGNVYTPDSVYVNNSVEVLGQTIFNSLVIQGDVTQTGNMFLNQNLSTTNLNIIGNVNINQIAQFEEILIDDNIITTTSSNSDLELKAAGTGTIIFASTTEIQNYLTVTDVTAVNVVTSNNITSTELISSNYTIRDNFISTTSLNTDIDLRASGAGQVIFNSDVDIQKNFIVTADTNISQNLVGNQTTTNLQASDISISNLYFNIGTLKTEGIDIWQDNITTVNSNSNLELISEPTRIILFDDTLEILNNLTVNSPTTINSNIDLPNLAVENFLINNSVNAENFYTTSIELFDNVINGNVSNADLELRANGSGIVSIPNNVQIANDLTVGSFNITGNVTLDDILAVDNLTVSDNGVLTTSEILTSGIRIWQNNISTINSNANLELRTNGTGYIVFKNIRFLDAEISNASSDITFTTPNLDINGTAALKIPVGSDAQRIDPQSTATGDFRFNTDSGIFEGFGISNIGFGGVYSDDRLTSLTVDSVSNVIRMIINGDDDPVDSTKLEIEIDHNAVYSQRLEIDEEISLDNNVIRTNVSNSDLEFRAGGTGKLELDQINFKDNKIQNVSNAYDGSTSAGILTIVPTGFGKIKINNTYGIVVPYGTTAEQPSDPPIGDTRWNTDSVILETWDGDQYIAAAGIAATIGSDEFNDLLLEYTLTLG